jgi:hypothetical protein
LGPASGAPASVVPPELLLLELPELLPELLLLELPELLPELLLLELPELLPELLLLELLDPPSSPASSLPELEPLELLLELELLDPPSSPASSFPELEPLELLPELELPELVPELLGPPSSPASPPELIPLPLLPPHAPVSARGTVARQANTKAFFMVVSGGGRTVLEENAVRKRPGPAIGVSLLRPHSCKVRAHRSKKRDKTSGVTRGHRSSSVMASSSCCSGSSSPG